MKTRRVIEAHGLNIQLSQMGLFVDYRHGTMAYVYYVYDNIIGPITKNALTALAKIAEIAKNGINITTADIEGVMSEKSYSWMSEKFYGSSSTWKLPNDINTLLNMSSDYNSLLKLYNDYKSEDSTLFKKRSTVKEVDEFIYDAVGKAFRDYSGSGLENSDNILLGASSAIFGAKNTVYSPLSLTIGYENTIGEMGSPHESASSMSIGRRIKVKGIGVFASGQNHTSEGLVNFIGGGDSNKILSSEKSSIIGGGNNKIEGSNRSAILAGAGVEIKDGEGVTVASGISVKVSSTEHSLIAGESHSISSSKDILVSGNNNTVTSSNYSIISGSNNNIKSSYSLIGGMNNQTTANIVFMSGKHLKNSRYCSAALGMYNIGRGTSLLEIGNGTGEDGTTDSSGNQLKRSNAFEVHQDGRAKVYGAPIEGNDVARLEEINKVHEVMLKSSVSDSEFFNSLYN